MALVAYLLLLVVVMAVRAAERPNILWLVSEDNTTLLGCYGDPLARTPTLDRLAHEGVLFERCFTQPVCAPSRFALITGLPPAACGPAHHMRAECKTPSWLKGFPALLREAGYFTSNNSKTDYNAPINVKEAWEQAGKNAHYINRPDKSKPFFSVFNHEVTHESCLFPERDDPRDFAPTDPVQVRVPPYQPDTPEIRADWARYYDRLAALDQQIATKLQTLEDKGLKEDTIVFYYADNGGVLPRSKRFLQRTGTHVPLIMYFPPKWQHLAPAKPGSRLKQPVSTVDFAPTVLSLAGVDIPTYMVGWPFAGPRVATNEFVFCSRDRMDERYDMMRSVMDSRWLYIRNYRPDLPYVQPLEYMLRARGYQSWQRLANANQLTSATHQFWGEKPSEELYDMDNDPDNVTNQAQDPAQRATLERMRAALKRRTLAINDNGFLPEGSVVEGYEASRAAGAYPLERVFELANLASDRDLAHLPTFLAALEDEHEAIRWWAAQGCTILGDRAAPAETALRARLQDESGAVQVAAAEALARQGKVTEALPVLRRCLENTRHLAVDFSPVSSDDATLRRWQGNRTNATFIVALQAANVLDRLGEEARPTLPAMKETLECLGAQKGERYEGYLQRILGHAVSELENKADN